MTDNQKQLTDELPEMNEIERIQYHKNMVFQTSLFLAIKFIILLIIRFGLYKVSHLIKEDVFLNHWIVTIVIMSYIFSLLLFGLTRDEYSPETLLVMNIITSILELVIVINTSYSQIATISVLSSISFFFFISFYSKITQEYSLINTFYFLMIEFVVVLLVFYAFCLEEFHEKQLGYFQFNAFMGFYIYQIYIAIYLADINNLIHITPMKVTLAMGLDFYRVLSSIAKELYDEFVFVDKSETNYNY